MPQCSARAQSTQTLLIVSEIREQEDAANHVASEQGDKFWNFLTKTLAGGMDPAEVGPMVLDAVLNDKFWILTHPEMAAVTMRQHQSMVDTQKLTR